MNQNRKKEIEKKYHLKQYQVQYKKLVDTLVKEHNLDKDISIYDGEEQLNKFHMSKKAYDKMMSDKEREVSEQVIKVVEKELNIKINEVIEEDDNFKLSLIFLEKVNEVANKMMKMEYQEYQRELSNKKNKISYEGYQKEQAQQEIELEFNNDKVKLKEIETELEKYTHEKLQIIQDNIELLSVISRNRHQLEVYDVLAINHYNNIDLIQLLPKIQPSNKYYKILEDLKAEKSIKIYDDEIIQELAQKLNHKVCLDNCDQDMYRILDDIGKMDNEDKENILRLINFYEEQNKEYKSLIKLLNNIGKLYKNTLKIEQ